MERGGGGWRGIERDEWEWREMKGDGEEWRGDGEEWRGMERDEGE